MSNRPRLLFYCQHSLGLGHLVRSFELARALSKRWNVAMLCGGVVPPQLEVPEGVEVIALPPLAASNNWNLVGVDRDQTVAQMKQLRRDMILRAMESIDPQVLVVELFPFGRKKFRDELIPLLEAARDKDAFVVCSLRDILVGRSEEQHDHDDRACELANRYFDIVLVHSDPRFARLDESFHPRRCALEIPVKHTGFVVPMTAGSPPPPREDRRPLIVSAGGGVAGERLLLPALEAHENLWPRHRIPTRIVAGPFLPEDAWLRLRRRAGTLVGLELHRHVPNLNSRLHTAAASVSQCGYNTAMGLVQAKVPALVVPFAEQGEDEQTNRAKRLERLGLVMRVDPEAVEDGALVEAIPELLNFRPSPTTLDMNGSEKSAAVLTSIVEGT